MARREYKGAAPETELASGISDVSSAFNVVGGGGAGYPTGAVGNFFVVIDPETANEEKILCTSRATDAFSCAGGRGADDTIAVAHPSGAKVRHVFTKTDADEANAHVNASTGVHGRTSALASISDTETLTNKSMSGASNTFSAIPQSAITSLVADLAAKLAVAAVHDTWEAIIAAAPGANWQAALAAGLDADSATVLGAMGTGWPAILGVAPGSGWANALDSALAANWQTALAGALGTNWTTALAATLAGDWTNILDSPINGGWLNVFAVDPATLRPVREEDSTVISGITSTSGIPGSPVVGFSFVAPPSGQVIVVISGSLAIGTDGFNIILGWEGRQGSTVGSGTIEVGYSAQRGIFAGEAVNTGAEAEAGGSSLYVWTGLTVGNTYNVRALYSVTGGTTGAIDHRRLEVIPVI